MNRKLFLAATAVLLFLGACTVSTTAPEPSAHASREEQSDTTTASDGGTMGNGN